MYSGHKLESLLRRRQLLTPGFESLVAATKNFYHALTLSQSYVERISWPILDIPVPLYLLFVFYRWITLLLVQRFICDPKTLSEPALLEPASLTGRQMDRQERTAFLTFKLWTTTFWAFSFGPLGWTMPCWIILNKLAFFLRYIYIRCFGFASGLVYLDILWVFLFSSNLSKTDVY